MSKAENFNEDQVTPLIELGVKLVEDSEDYQFLLDTIRNGLVGSRQTIGTHQVIMGMVPLPKENSTQKEDESSS